MNCCSNHPHPKDSGADEALVQTKPRVPRVVLLGAALLFLVVSLYVWFSQQPNERYNANGQSRVLLNGETKSDSGEGGVTVLAAMQESGDQLTFTVQLETHSVNLDDFDASKQIVLAARDGNMQGPTNVVSSGSGHHREFILSFDNAKKPFRLVVTNLASVPVRELLWEE